MRRVCDTPPLVKAANLARWLPPWTVYPEQWTSLSRPSASGIAVDTLLFSRIGVPMGLSVALTHGAFHGSYMRRMHASEVQTIQALMELALPRFEGLGDGPRQVHRSWMESTELPALPDTGGFTVPLWWSSPCLNLDVLSSDNTEGSVGISNLAVTLLCSSDDGHTPVYSDQVLSDEDLPPEAVSDDLRLVIQIRDISPDVQIVDIFSSLSGL